LIGSITLGIHECLIVIGRDSDAEVDELIRRAADAAAEIVLTAGTQIWGGEPAAYAGAFTDPDGHMWQVSWADGVLIR
jgi:uncharacterized glyoxalase superfamily protein PhnB